ncbi:MAG: WYL domain-containing protein [Corynebacterium sp.]|nr:WYL domain-containing protein [Corynebacterium sp.]
MNALRKGDDFRFYRMISLYTILLHALQTPRPWLTTTQLKQKLASVEPSFVAGEGATFTNRLNRDMAALSSAGIPIIRRDNGPGAPPEFRLREDEYLEPVEFTAGEWEVLQVVSQLAIGRRLGEPASLSVLKLAGFAADHDRSDDLEVRSFNETLTIDPALITTLTKAIRAQQQVILTYQRDPSHSPQQRRVEPWGIFAIEARPYLVVFDTDKQDTRTFRLTRITDVTRTGEPAVTPRPADVESAVWEKLRVDRDLITARVRIAAGEAVEIARLGEPVGPTDYVLRDAPREWVIEQALHYAESVVVVEPVDVRESIVATLRALAGGEGDDRGTPN